MNWVCEGEKRVKDKEKLSGYLSGYGNIKQDHRRHGESSVEATSVKMTKTAVTHPRVISSQ